MHACTRPLLRVLHVLYLCMYQNVHVRLHLIGMCCCVCMCIDM